jgi:hypothetical protein
MLDVFANDQHGILMLHHVFDRAPLDGFPGAAARPPCTSSYG